MVGGVESASTQTAGAEPWTDAVVDAYKRGVDETLLVEQLRRTPEERMRRIEEMQHAVLALQRAARGRDR
jgi:hypothetical protein